VATPASTLATLAAEARRWLFQDAANRWAIRRSGEVALFPERFSLEGQIDDAPRRLLVQARCIYAYCEMGRLGWSGDWRSMAADGIGFLLRRGRRDDGFFIHAFDAAGAVHDARADLYDHAFALLALAHAGRALGDPALFAAADELADLLDSRWRLASGAYHEGEIALTPPRRQNPHMHLLEAFIALEWATGETRWRARAQAVADLCRRHFIDAATGALLEYFGDRLEPAPGVAGRTVEPGHCFEWAWLFEILTVRSLADAADLSDALVRFARRSGIDSARGVAVGEVTTDGQAITTTARLWPQTERLKAALARYRRTRDGAEAAEAAAAYAGLAKYLDVETSGLWRDKLRADGSWVEEPAPGSSLYHIACAIAELIDAAHLPAPKSS
jgi:mannose/cellobiose epimerase-like protein (N-acyl-D-glucosamine 2-epimerase family)